VLKCYLIRVNVRQAFRIEYDVGGIQLGVTYMIMFAFYC